MLGLFGSFFQRIKLALCHFFTPDYHSCSFSQFSMSPYSTFESKLSSVSVNLLKTPTSWFLPHSLEYNSSFFLKSHEFYALFVDNNAPHFQPVCSLCLFNCTRLHRSVSQVSHGSDSWAIQIPSTYNPQKIPHFFDGSE